ncbi:hypothetical protein ON010_g8711 [Phytophthora cinnamomi]|nr:hypothetical protein ON010_g8711 [Phytophthora cinnamomi]
MPAPRLPQSPGHQCLRHSTIYLDNPPPRDGNTASTTCSTSVQSLAAVQHDRQQTPRGDHASGEHDNFDLTSFLDGPSSMTPAPGQFQPRSALTLDTTASHTEVAQLAAQVDSLSALVHELRTQLASANSLPSVRTTPTSTTTLIKNSQPILYDSATTPTWTVPAASGELPPVRLWELRRSSFPSTVSRGRSDYNPHPTHILVAYRSIQNLAKPDVRSSSNANFPMDFISVTLPPEQPAPCSSYDEILPALSGLSAFGSEFWYPRKINLLDQLCRFVTDNQTADPTNSPGRVTRTLQYANVYLGRAVAHLTMDTPSWWRDLRTAIAAIEYKSLDWLLALQSFPTVNTANSTSQPGSAPPRHLPTTRPHTMPEHLRQQIPRRLDGTEPCLRFLGKADSPMLRPRNEDNTANTSVAPSIHHPLESPVLPPGIPTTLPLVRSYSACTHPPATRREASPIPQHTPPMLLIGKRRGNFTTPNYTSSSTPIAYPTHKKPSTLLTNLSVASTIDARECYAIKLTNTDIVPYAHIQIMPAHRPLGLPHIPTAITRKKQSQYLEKYPLQILPNGVHKCQPSLTVYIIPYSRGPAVGSSLPSQSTPKSRTREILRQSSFFPKHDVKIVLGDVAVAFRNLSVHSECAHLFAGTIPEENALVIDLSACFGWVGSPGFYGLAGNAIAHILGHASNTLHPQGFFNYHWVDDHVCIHMNTATRRNDVEQSIRAAMAIVLGPDAVNNKTFTHRATTQKVFGLRFDTIRGTAVM